MINKVKHAITSFLRTKGYGYYKIPVFGRKENKYIYFKRLYDSIAHLKGDIVECGVGCGTSFSVLVGLAEAEKKQRLIWGFDSFEGFPEPTIHDKSPRNSKKGDWNYSTPDLIVNLLLNECKIERNFVQNNVKIIKGFFQENLEKKYTGEKIALLHLDVDLYDSYKTCLEVLWPKVVDGGVVILDEYRGKKTFRKFPGAVKAIDEFFQENKKYIRENSKFRKHYIYKQSK